MEEDHHLTHFPYRIGKRAHYEKSLASTVCATIANDAHCARERGKFGERAVGSHVCTSSVVTSLDEAQYEGWVRKGKMLYDLPR